jgi:hypothetical protein
MFHLYRVLCAVYLFGYSNSPLPLEANKPILLRQNEKQAGIQLKSQY